MKKFLLLLGLAGMTMMTSCTTTTPGEAVWSGTQAVHGFVSGAVGAGVGAIEGGNNSTQ